MLVLLLKYLSWFFLTSSFLAQPFHSPLCLSFVCLSVCLSVCLLAFLPPFPFSLILSFVILHLDSFRGRAGFYRSFVEAERRGLVFVNPRRNYGKADTLEKALEEKQFRIKDMVRRRRVFHLKMRSCRVSPAAAGSAVCPVCVLKSTYIESWQGCHRYTTSRRMMHFCNIAGGVRLGIFRTSQSPPLPTISTYVPTSMPVLFHFRRFLGGAGAVGGGGQMDPETGERLHELEHEIRSVAHPSYPVGRDLSATMSSTTPI